MPIEIPARPHPQDVRSDDTLDTAAGRDYPGAHSQFGYDRSY